MMVRPVAEEYFSNGLDKEVLSKLIKLSSLSQWLGHAFINTALSAS